MIFKNFQHDSLFLRVVAVMNIAADQIQNWIVPDIRESADDRVLGRSIYG